MKRENILSKELEAELELQGLSRRDFLKYCAATAALFSLSAYEFTAGIVQAMETASKKPPVIWLEGQDCADCTIAFTQILNPPASSTILDKISLRYHETAMAAAGHLSEKAFEATVKKGGYVLIVEGSVPGADDRYCMIGGRPFRKILEEAAAKAGAIIPVGACATYGGIPAATPSKGMGLDKALPKKTVINLPTCPVHPDRLAGTILYYLGTGKVPELDKFGRPVMYYRELIHDNCRRRGHFDASEFLTDWNDPKQKDWCMVQKGCQGPITHADCPIRRWNDGINFCISRLGFTLAKRTNAIADFDVQVEEVAHECFDLGLPLTGVFNQQADINVRTRKQLGAAKTTDCNQCHRCLAKVLVEEPCQQLIK